MLQLTFGFHGLFFQAQLCRSHSGGLKPIHQFFDTPPIKRQSLIALSLNLGWAEFLPSEE